MKCRTKSKAIEEVRNHESNGKNIYLQPVQQSISSINA